MYFIAPLDRHGTSHSPIMVVLSVDANWGVILSMINLMYKIHLVVIRLEMSRELMKE